MYDLQYGFREKRSSETQPIILVEGPARSASVGKQTDLILLGFSKAIDKVSHSKLQETARLWNTHRRMKKNWNVYVF